MPLETIVVCVRVRSIRMREYANATGDHVSARLYMLLYTHRNKHAAISAVSSTSVRAKRMRVREYACMFCV